MKKIKKQIECWKDSFRAKKEDILGVYVAEGMLHLAALSFREGKWEISHALQCPLDSSAGELSEEEAAAEQVRICSAREGMGCGAVAWAVPEEQAMAYAKEFPDLREDELQEALHWEMEGGQTEEDDALWASCRMPGGENLFCLASLPKRKARQIQEACKANGLSLAALSVCPDTGEFQKDSQEVSWRGHTLPLSETAGEIIGEEGMYAALYAALSAAFGEEGMNFLHREKPSPWNWARLSALAASACAAVFLAVYAVGAWQLYDADRQVQQGKSQLAMLSGDRRNQESIEKTLVAIEDKQRILQELSAGQCSWYAILVHFGTLTAEGAWLDELAMDEPGQLMLKGKAVDYDALAAFLQRLEKDKDFFKESPILENSSAGGQGNAVDFSLHLRL